jgi:hypothetical protein
MAWAYGVQVEMEGLYEWPRDVPLPAFKKENPIILLEEDWDHHIAKPVRDSE